jgi:hypothetical protein
VADRIGSEVNGSEQAGFITSFLTDIKSRDLIRAVKTLGEDCEKGHCFAVTTPTVHAGERKCAGEKVTTTKGTPTKGRRNHELFPFFSHVDRGKHHTFAHGFSGVDDFLPFQ